MLFRFTIRRLRRLTELNRTAYTASRTLTGNSLKTDESGNVTTALNFQSLRRTSSTLFGARARDPKLTQTHMRHTDPQMTLKHYQQAIPAEVKAAAIALETQLLEELRKREAEAANVRVV